MSEKQRQRILEKIRTFPPERIDEILDFIEFIDQREKRKAWIELDEWAMNLARKKGFHHLTEEAIVEIVRQHRLRS